MTGFTLNYTAQTNNGVKFFCFSKPLGTKRKFKTARNMFHNYIFSGCTMSDKGVNGSITHGKRDLVIPFRYNNAEFHSAGVWYIRRTISRKVFMCSRHTGYNKKEAVSIFGC